MTGEQVLEEFDALLAYGFEVPDALEAVGKSYGAARKIAERSGRADVLATLSAWKKADAERLQRARGLAWA